MRCCLPSGRERRFLQLGEWRPEVCRGWGWLTFGDAVERAVLRIHVALRSNCQFDLSATWIRSAEEKNSCPTGIPNELCGQLKEKKFIQNCISKIWKDVTDTSTILKRIVEYYMIWSGFIWHKIKANDSLMWICYWSVWCNKNGNVVTRWATTSFSKKVFYIRSEIRKEARTV